MYSRTISTIMSMMNPRCSSDLSGPWIPPWEYRIVRSNRTKNCLTQTFRVVPIHDINEEMRLQSIVDDATPDVSSSAISYDSSSSSNLASSSSSDTGMHRADESPVTSIQFSCTACDHAHSFLDTYNDSE